MATTEWGTGVVTGGALYCRKSPSTSADYWGRFENNKTIPIKKTTDSSWYETYWNNDTSKVGYVMATYITGENFSGGGTGSGTTTPTGIAAGRYVQVSSSYNSVNVRASTSTSSTLRGVLLSGTKVICSQVVNSQWVKIIWGGTGSSDAYIMTQYLVDGGAAPTSKAQRVADIANSMNTGKYPYNGSIGNLGLNATQWCVQYVSWLYKAAGCTKYPDFSTQANVSGAVSFFNANGSFGYRTPKVGDCVVYKKTGSTSSDPTNYYAHVGVVVAVSGSLVTTVEGNLSKTIKSPGQYNWQTATQIGGNNFSVMGFGTPSWT